VGTEPIDVDALVRRLREKAWFNIGFPGATDLDFSKLGPALAVLLNNIGDPLVNGVAANHTKSLERRVVDFLADLFRAPLDDRWGYVTTGGSEGNLYALTAARQVYPKTIVYHSRAAHPSVTKATDLLGLDRVVIATREPGDEINYVDLAEQLARHRDRPATVVATAGTTMHESFDDVATISQILRDQAIGRRFIHVDAALSGVPLALCDPGDRPGFDLGDGADSITVSGHKFLGTPTPSGVVIIRNRYRVRFASAANYTGSPDVTISGSRSGHAPLMLWYAIEQLGVDGLRRRAEESRALATYTAAQLDAMGWPVHRDHRLGFTVTLATPPPAVTARWVLADGADNWSHIVCAPGVTRPRIDAFIYDLRTALPRIPTQRTVHEQPTPA
jgi:histidine decarboxylase